MKNNWKIENSEFEREFEDFELAMEKIVRRRGISRKSQLESFFFPDYEKDLHDPFLLGGMKEAVEVLKKAKKEKRKVCIYGDYDADGVTSSVLLHSFLNELDIENFCYIPDREKEGYGMNAEAIDYINEKKASLIITVDCGVTSKKEVEYAKKKGLEVIILDHHHAPKQIPKAAAVVDPKIKNQQYPFSELAGVGVVFKFIQAAAGKIKSYKEENLKWYLDLVAIGTVADCVPLVDENRVLVKFGLIVLSKSKNAGLKQLIKVARIEISERSFPESRQISFQLAPRINAAGRMDHANMAYELLKADPEEIAQARNLALQLEAQNQHRQKVTGHIIKKVEDDLAKKKEPPKIIVAKSPHWAIGVIGLAAGKIADKFNRPTVLLQEKGSICRGSGRSIEGFNLIELLERNAGWLSEFGGHNQAAGLTIDKKNYKKFKEALLEDAEKNLPEDLAKKIVIDAEVDESEVNGKLCKEISMLEPFGEGNEMPVLLWKKAVVADKKLIGKNGDHLKVWFKGESGQKLLEGIGFGFGADFEKIKTGDKLDILFNLEENNWNGNKNIQLKLIDWDN
ncbi:MAG: single-stranded-DNA-specific exonuclease RecJ [Candidatus Moranbacteria bacterium]|nr:single-stranded-DNA-specific exonuclease RecJ [Candidatus Moranbacteria bacterium]